MSSPINTLPPWRSYTQTGNIADIVSSPTVAHVLGQKIDAISGQASGLSLDGSSTLANVPVDTVLNSFPAKLVTSYGVQNDPQGAFIEANTTAYLNALSDCAGRYTLVHPAGLSVVLNSITLTQSYLHLEMNGVWTLAPNANQNILNIGSAGQNLTTIQISGTGTFDGNKTQQQGGTNAVSGGICANTISHTNSTPDNPSSPASITNLVIDGVTIQNVFNWPISLGHITNSTVQNTRLLNSGNSPQFIWSADNSWFLNNVSSGHNDGGFVFYMGCRHCGAIGNSIYNNSDGIGVYCDSSTQPPNDTILINSNIVYNNADSGIGITTANQTSTDPSALIQRNIMVTNNLLYNNNRSGRNGGGSIGLVAGYNVTVAHNTIYGDGATSTSTQPSYSLYISDSCSSIIIESNRISNVGSATSPGTAIFLNNPTNTLVRHNIIFDSAGASGTTVAGIAGGFGAGGILAGNEQLTPLNGYLLEVNTPAGTKVQGQEIFGGAASFSSGLDISGGNVTLHNGSLALNNGPLALTSFSTAGGAGSSAADAASINQQYTVIIQTQSGGGLILPTSSGTGVEYTLYNRAGEAVNIYPPPGGQMESQAPNTPISIPNGRTGRFVMTSVGHWFCDL